MAARQSPLTGQSRCNEAVYETWLETCAAASVKNGHEKVRQFFRWCEKEGEVPEGRNPMRNILHQCPRIRPTSCTRR
jgi:hypothetical protein